MQIGAAVVCSFIVMFLFFFFLPFLTILSCMSLFNFVSAVCFFECKQINNLYDANFDDGDNICW